MVEIELNVSTVYIFSQGMIGNFAVDHSRRMLGAVSEEDICRNFTSILVPLTCKHAVFTVPLLKVSHW